LKNKKSYETFIWKLSEHHSGKNSYFYREELKACHMTKIFKQFNLFRKR